MDINQLRIFQKVAQLENMSKASSQLYVSQPAISKTIKQLETELSVSLFYRFGKHITLNESGKILLKHANSILSELDDIKNELDEHNSLLKNEVIFSMQAGSSFLPRIISEFCNIHPEIKLSVVQKNNPFDNKKPDLCVFASRLKPNSPDCISILKENIMIAIPHNHRLAYNKSIKLSQLSNESFISLSKGSALEDITKEYCNMVGFIPNVIIESDNPSVIRELLKLNMGIAFIPEITWDEIHDDSLHILSISDPICTRYINLQFNSNSYMPKAVELLKDYIISFFGSI